MSKSKYSLIKTEEADIVEGWLGKPNGIKQLLGGVRFVGSQGSVTNQQNSTLSWQASKLNIPGVMQKGCIGMPSSPKNGKDFIQSLIQKCLSTKKGKGKGCLTTTIIYKFSMWARYYILTYIWIEHGMEESKKKEELRKNNIKRINKFKTHCKAVDYDEKCINNCFIRIKMNLEHEALHQ
jgi:hypothetical protein